MSEIDPRRFNTSHGSGETVAPGRVDVDLELGPVRVRLIDLPTTWDPFVSEHYDPFCSPASGDREPHLVVQCEEVPEATVVPLPPPGGGTVLELEERGDGTFRICSHWQDGWVDPTAGRGKITLSSRAYIPFRMSVENYLRIASQLMLIQRGGFLMHSAGILDEGRCFLFFGPSGAGKSTATANSAPRAALSDDMVLIDVSGGAPMAHAVPFFGAFPPRERVRGAFPIAAACRLRQAEADRLVSLAGARAVATVSASVPFVHELGLPHTGLTERVARLCAGVPVRDLYLTKSSGFWDLLLRDPEIGRGPVAER